DVVKQLDAMKLRTPRPDFEQPPGVVVVPMDLTSGRRGVGPCSRVVMEAFVAGQEPDKDCNGGTVAVSKLPYYLQRPFYQAKEAEPFQAANDASARSGESAESPAPDVEESPGETSTAPPAEPSPAAPPAPVPPAPQPSPPQPPA